MQSLSMLKIEDDSGKINLDGKWYANANDESEYYLCVSYVANVRTAKGVIWRYNFAKIKEELNKMGVKYEEGYVPNNSKDKR